MDKFGPGPSPILTDVVEKELVLWITTLTEKGFPADWSDVEMAATEFAAAKVHAH